MQEQLGEVEMAAWTSLVGVVLWLPGALDTALKGHGLSHHEFQILRWLEQCDSGTRTMGDLAETASVTPSHLSRIAARLETRGWIVRRPDPADARFTLASLTDDGRRKVEECAPAYYATVREHLFDRLSPEQARQLGEITGEILYSLVPACRPK
ncbi:MarR family winged helix-turn-helix transcriptional regulator [Actinoplanes couchii]|uniref:MarR family transcriptional regulator n=1 Tax=Actinoplanes couchii TaxID=403638 RepID=A0ABQ3XTB1_9ACTN|nr:MarR family transcriptional regulator [Actinoplanes couchii]MDR6317020.1 DNA-binding MarR family transcriptional regulator [Actinoplanes couchii]GID61733.1 MarR family transcriptional regulator [Actinoplanes couchii]